jgi:AraC-like DNA-binding protein
MGFSTGTQAIEFRNGDLARPLPAGDVGEEAVANALHMSVRTLHRKFRQKNLAFK